VTPNDDHESGDDGEIVGQEIVKTCSNHWKDPAPLDEEFSEIVRMPDQTPPSRHDNLPSTRSLGGLQVRERWVVGVLGKLASLHLRGAEDDVAHEFDEDDASEEVPGHVGGSVNEVLGDEGGEEGVEGVGGDQRPSEP